MLRLPPRDGTFTALFYVHLSTTTATALDDVHPVINYSDYAMLSFPRFVLGSGPPPAWHFVA